MKATMDSQPYKRDHFAAAPGAGRGLAYDMLWFARNDSSSLSLFSSPEQSL